MKRLTLRSVSVYTKREKEILRTPLDETDGATFTLRAEEIDGGYAYYVTATNPAGFPADAAVAFTPEIPDTADYLAINNHSDFWCRPFWGSSLRDLPKRTQELLIRDGERYLCILPVVADAYKTLLCGGKDGLEIFLSSNVDGLTECRDQLSFLVMEDTDPMRLLRRIAETAASLLGNGMRMREERTVAPVFDYLGWCSWDAFEIRISHADMVKKAEEFREKGVPVGFAIFDDMWADAPLLRYVAPTDSRRTMIRIMHASMLRSFEGDPVRFPQGMKAAVADVKRAGIPYVGVWFPTTGYWSGLQAGGEIADELRDCTVLSEERRQIIASPEEEKATAYFDTLCGRVRAWGGDFVKIDNQGYHARYRNLATVGESSRAIGAAIESATEKHFGGALINCMGMPSECMFGRNRSAVSRCSDDFQPESRPWFAKNVLQCAYNGLLQGQYYVNDWDMWWTDDEQARKNSLCRAVSGGPIYVSDKLGRTNPEVLRPLILSDGRILRCDESATPSADCLFRDPTGAGQLFKIRNRIGSGAVLAVFNIDAENRPLSGTVSPRDAGLPAGDYLAYEYFTGACRSLSDGDVIDLSLEDNDAFRLYTFLPKGDRFTAVGRTDLFIGAKAVTAVDGATVTLIEGGPTAVWSEAPVCIEVDGKEIPTAREGSLTRFTLPKGSTVFTVL